MENAELLANIGKGFDGLGTKFSSALDQAVAHLQETVSKPVVKLDAAPKLETEEVAEMASSGVLGGITGMEVWNIPIGKALVGGFVAVFGTELIDGFMASQSVQVRGAVKLVGAGIALKWGRKLLGTDGATAVGLLMAFDGIRDILPIDQYAKQLANMASGVVTQRGLASINDSRAVREAEDVAGYAAVGGFYPGINRRSG